MKISDYHSDSSRISKSGLDLFSRSPRHYWARYLDPNREPHKPTPALITGDAVHTAMLEPDRFAREYVVLPAFNNRSNEGKEQKTLWLAANEGKTVIDMETYELSCRLRDKIHAHPIAAELLKIGKVEQTYTWEDEETGAPCKCRLDFLTPDRLVLDLKTTMDASPEAFGRSAFRYRYHVQSAFYSDGYAANFGYLPEAFVFIAVETEPPYEIGIYHADDAIVSLGRSTYIPELHRYQACRRTGIWPGYSPKIEALKLPGYAYRT